MLRPETDVPGEFGRMTQAGVESVVMELNWSVAQPAEGVAPDFARSDAIVLAAAARGMRVLPIVVFAPEWARVSRDQIASPPQPEHYAEFLRSAIARYGPAGSLWTEHPDVARVPIRSWQVWNEPSHEGFWTQQPFAPGYVALLRAARAAIKGADPGARVVLAGLVYDSWTQLQSLYKAGARGLFDVLSLHPYTRKLGNVILVLRRNRRVLDRHGGKRIPIVATEISWPSAKGKTQSTYGYEVTEREQAREASRALPRLASERRRLRLEAVYWFSWLSDDRDPVYPFDYAGLRTTADGGRDKPALAAYRAAALRLEGCRAKGATVSRASC